MSSTPKSTTQAVRRAKFGASVLIASAAALGLVILVDAIAYLYLKPMPPIDLTATGMYTLSPQTKRVLAKLDKPHKIVTLFSSRDPELEPAEIKRAADLIDQYPRYTSNLTVEHISPGSQTTQLEAFLGKLYERYRDQLAPLASAVKKGQKTLENLAGNVDAQNAALAALAKDPQLPGDDLGRLVQQAAQAFRSLAGQVSSSGKEIEQALQGPLPAYDSAKTTLDDLLTKLDERFYAVIIRQFEQAVKLPSTPGSVGEKLRVLNEEFQKTRNQLHDAAVALRAAKTVQEYNDLRDNVNSNPNSVVIIGPDRVRVMWLSNMFRKPQARDIPAGQTPELLFQGEEKITGALFSMSLANPPMIVFVSAGPRPTIAPGGDFSYVAQRLQSLNFDVKSWNPSGEPGPMGQPTPPSPPPEPGPGQPVVWVILPSPAESPMDMSSARGDQQIAELLQNRLDKGESALVMLSASPTARFSGKSPIVTQIESWGIKPQLDRMILRKYTGADGRTSPQAQFELTDWPDDLPITQALAGLRGLFFGPSPIRITSEKDVKVWPLVTLKRDGMWAEQDFAGADVKFDPKASEPSFTIAAAAERNGHRLVVVADPVWASDTVTTHTVGYVGDRGLVIGAAFPADAELFVNSVQWLAKLDDLIAASARTQDIRRVGAISPTAASSIQWGLLAGMPAAIFGVGIGVWLMRRRG